MKREPNPYSKNPILTVTNTMSISVPSMVAEDVLDGTDTPIITTDPEVHGRIDAVSEAVELMDTRIDYVADALVLHKTNIDASIAYVADRTELLYGTCLNADRALSDRIDVLELHGTGDSPLTLSGFAGAYKDYDSTVLDYKLGLDLDPETRQAYLIVKNGSGVNWKPLQLGSGSLASVTTTSDKLYRLEFSQENSFMYALSQQYSSSELAYCNGIACNYFRDPAGAAWLHHTEMRFQKNTSTGALEIQLRGDKDHSWITVASTADTSSSESGGGISFSTRGGTDYSLGFEVDKNADDYSAVVSLTSTGSNEFSGITALSTWLGAPSSDIGDTHVFMAVSGMGTLVFKSSDGMSKYDLSNLGGSSDSTDSKLEIKSGENSDKKTFIVETSKTYRDTVMSLQLYSTVSKTSQLYAVAAPWFASSDSSNYGMRIVPDSDLSNMLELTTNGGASWNKLPWPTISGGSSGSAAGVYELGLLDNGSDSGSRMLPLISSPNLTSGVNVELLSWAIGSSTSDAQDTSGMYTLVGNPIALYDSAYRAPNDSRIKGAVRVVDMHGKICWQRYSYTQRQWLIESGDGSSSSGSAAGVYELGLLDNGNDSGSHMMPLVAETSTSLGGGSRSLAAVRWSIGASTTESNDLSGVYTLMANPLALFGHYHNSIDDIHITGAIRPMLTSAGNLAWQKLDYSTKQWKPIGTDAKIEITEAYEGIFNVKAEKYDYYQGKNVLVNVPALTSGLGAVFNNTSIVACLKADTASSLRSSGVGIQKTGWNSQYTSFYGGEYDITELVVRAPQICEIASHLSQIQWLCENTESIKSLLNK